LKRLDDQYEISNAQIGELKLKVTQLETTMQNLVRMLQVNDRRVMQSSNIFLALLKAFGQVANQFNPDAMNGAINDMQNHVESSSPLPLTESMQPAMQPESSAAIFF
jgi:hypothetical protein